MLRSPSGRLLALPTLLALVLVACGGGAASEAASEVASAPPSEAAQPSEMAEPSSDAGASEPAEDSTEVRLAGFAFSPGQITVAAGTAVTFVNEDEAPHTVTHGSDGRAEAEAIVDESLASGAELTFTFEEPGTYQITCKIHPSMNMTVVVEG